MCANFDLSRSRQSDVRKQFGLTKDLFTTYQDEKSFFPKFDVPVVGNAGHGRRLMIPARWGLIPNWSNDPASGPQPFNARSDEVTKNLLFRESFEQRRCIIPVAGFYEWTAQRPKASEARGSEAPKVRYRLSLADGSLLGIASIYDVWEVEGEPRVVSAAMITHDPNDLIHPWHHRMPVILRPEHYGFWLDPDAPTDELTGLFQSYPASLMVKTEAPPKQRAKREKPVTPALFDE